MIHHSKGGGTANWGKCKVLYSRGKMRIKRHDHVPPGAVNWDAAEEVTVLGQILSMKDERGFVGKIHRPDLTRATGM